eukprot:scaffold7841_cov128-Isochrysis_galbana.AAC.5
MAIYICVQRTQCYIRHIRTHIRTEHRAAQSTSNSLRNLKAQNQKGQGPRRRLKLKALKKLKRSMGASRTIGLSNSKQIGAAHFIGSHGRRRARRTASLHIRY